jgi:hypothetical protein
MSEITVKDHVYKTGRLDAFTQLHIVRRLGPALIVAGVSIEVLKSGTKLYLQDMVRMAEPVMSFVGQMREEDVDYILLSCLRVIQRKEGDRWMSINSGTRDLQYNDIDMIVLLRLVVEVLKDNIGSFLTGLSDEQPSTKS